MADIIIYHKRTEPFMCCNGKDICQIILHYNDYKVHAKRNSDKLKFKRKGNEANAGFEIKLDKAIGNSDTYSTEKSTMDINIPADQPEGNYKYTLSYPYDKDATVAPLDPIIIIVGESIF